MISRKAGKPLLLCAALVGTVLAVMLISARPSHAQGKASAPAKPPSATVQQLTPEQRDYYREQARYYKFQVDKPWWRYLLESGAFIAAVGALIAFYLNYRATLRAQHETQSLALQAQANAERYQTDTQFYEALKRFGDSIPIVRSSAAGLLAQMAKAHGTYMDTTVDQLVTGLQLEDNEVVLAAIGDAITKTIEVSPPTVEIKLYAANLKLQEALVYALADFVVASVRYRPDAKREDYLEEAGLTTGYGAKVLNDLITRCYWEGKFKDRMLTSPRLIVDGTGADIEGNLREAGRELRTACIRLQANVRLCAAAILKAAAEMTSLGNAFLVSASLRNAQLRRAGLWCAQMYRADCPEAQLEGASMSEVQLGKANLHKANLQGADLTFAELQGALLHETHLQKADLYGAKLQGAHFLGAWLDDAVLAKAEVDNKTSLMNTNWWKADFGGGIRCERDTALLEQLYERYGKDVPEDLNEVHPSAQAFIAQKRREEQAAIDKAKS